MHPLPQIHLLPYETLQLPQENGGTLVIHWLQFLHRTHRVRTRHRSFNIAMLFLISDGKNSRHWASGGSNVEHFVEIALVEGGQLVNRPACWEGQTELALWNLLAMP